MASRKLSLTLESPVTTLQLAPSDFMKGVRRARVRALSYDNKNARRVLSVSIPQIDQGRHYQGGLLTFESRCAVMFLGPQDSTTAVLNAGEGWDAAFPAGEEITRIEVRLRFDGEPGTAADVFPANPVLLELEFEVTK